MSAATIRFSQYPTFPPVGRAFEGAQLSEWLDMQAAWYLSLGTDRGLLMARVLGDLSAQFHAVESPGAAPITVEEALDRIDALRHEED